MATKSGIPPSEEVVKLCKPLILNDEQLQQYMKMFLGDIQAGLAKQSHPTAIVKCFITYVQELPNGSELGKFLALDLGGTNFRVLVINLKPKHFEMKAKVYAIPQKVMIGTGKQLFDHISDCLYEFCKDNRLLNMDLPLGFTFSFPLRQEGISRGYLEKWTKGFNCPDVVGQDVVAMLKQSLQERQDIKINVCAILNDTTGTLMSCAWKDHNTKVGLIIGTGTNACYVEKVENCEMFSGPSTGPYVVVNTESGAFGDDGKLDYVRTVWDDNVDKNSVNPGKQLNEKMISGMYMGEIVRLVLVDAIRKKAIVSGEMKDTISTRYQFLSKNVSEIESDAPGEFTNVKAVFSNLGYPELTDQDCVNIRYICECVSRRAALMVSAKVATLVNKMQYAKVSVGIDGSLFRFHPGFQELMTIKMKQLVNPKIQFKLVLAEDGSGRGAALVAAVLARQMKEQLLKEEGLM